MEYGYMDPVETFKISPPWISLDPVWSNWVVEEEQLLDRDHSNRLDDAKRPTGDQHTHHCLDPK